MSNNYAGKFVSAETAVKAVQPGDWVDYGFGAGFRASRPCAGSTQG